MKKLCSLLTAVALAATLAAPAMAEQNALVENELAVDTVATAESATAESEEGTTPFTVTYVSNWPLGQGKTVTVQENLTWYIAFEYAQYFGMRRPGYFVPWWNTKPDGSGISYYTDREYKIPEGNSITVYAVWVSTDPNPTEPQPTNPPLYPPGTDPRPTELPAETPAPSDQPTTPPTTEPTAAPTATPTAKPGAKPTGVEGFITRLYEVCLGRTPGASELNGWVNQLTSGETTGTAAAYGFVFSPEFQAKNYCNEHYITYLYKAFMDRAPSDADLKGWAAQLEQGKTREEVFNGFAQSIEFGTICTSYGVAQGVSIEVPKPGYGTVPHGPCALDGKKDGVTAFVERLYTVCLGRGADAAGLKDWTAQLWNHTASGAEVAHGFIFSDEFQGKNYSNTDFVKQLYRAFMGREADSAGLADWVSQLDTGKTRESVLEGFVGSDEFTAICAAASIARG